MSGGLHRAFTWAGSAVLVLGCATAPTDRYARHAVEGLELAPYGVHEDCRRLEIDDRLDFAFESTEPVNFDLRYRQGNAVLIPLARAQSRGDSGVYVAPLTEEFCLAWEAGRDGAKISYHFRLLPPVS